MKKYLMIGAAALLMGASFTSCSKDKDLYDPTANAAKFLQDYQAAFISVFGTPAANQTWGFGDPAQARMTRSMATPVVADITKPYDEDWVAEYLDTATEPNSSNVADNGGAIWTIIQGGRLSSLLYNYEWCVANGAVTQADKDYYTENILPLFQKYGNNPYEMTRDHQMEFMDVFEEKGLEYWGVSSTFVLKFKITGTYNGTIGVAASEGYDIIHGQNGETTYGNKLEPFLARTIVVTGTWNINENQRMGSGSLIVIANGGKVNVANGKQLQTVNHARIVVLPGGELTGEGFVEVSNGNGAGEENYNGGIISVKKFNNNFGKFYNYGKFLVEEYIGGAMESNFYNHGLVHIKYTGLNNETPNARIYNNCQWYCEENMRCYIYEGVGGSSFIVGKQLMVSYSADGTSSPTYVSLAAGALVKAGSLYTNGTNWVGPTEGGYAVLSVGKIDYMNWTQDHPEVSGYFINNLYVQADDLSNNPEGNNVYAGEGVTVNAEYKLKNVVGNKGGNGNMTIVEKGNYEIIPADVDFELGVKGCTPGFKIKKDDDPKPETKSIRIMAEDVAASAGSDIDFNDLVFDVKATFPVENGAVATSVTTVSITIQAAGGTMPIYINGREAHAELGLRGPNAAKTMVNTNAAAYADGVNYFAEDDVEPASFDLTIDGGISKANFLQDVNEKIKITLQREGSEIVVIAHPGEPTAKIAVPVGTPWAKEKVNMSTAFSDFSAWVQTCLPTEWYKIYDGDMVIE